MANLSELNINMHCVNKGAIYIAVYTGRASPTHSCPGFSENKPLALLLFQIFKSSCVYMEALYKTASID